MQSLDCGFLLHMTFLRFLNSQLINSDVTFYIVPTNILPLELILLCRANSSTLLLKKIIFIRDLECRNLLWQASLMFFSARVWMGRHKFPSFSPLRRSQTHAYTHLNMTSLSMLPLRRVDLLILWAACEIRWIELHTLTHWRVMREEP